MSSDFVPEQPVDRPEGLPTEEMPPPDTHPATDGDHAGEGDPVGLVDREGPPDLRDAETPVDFRDNEGPVDFRDNGDPVDFRDPPPAEPYPVAVTAFVCGDVMTGRGGDQSLPPPGDPRLWESYVRDARAYVELAEAASGSIPAPVDFTWPWGDALAVLAAERPDVRVINLETSV